MPVVDASVVVEYLVAGEHFAEVKSRLLTSASALWAPHLIDAEVGHVLRRAVAEGRVGGARARAALDELAELPLHRTAHVGLLDRAWSLRRNVSFYDGLYLALAERLKMRLLTLDARLAKASGVRVPIEVIAG
jgi:predicted nucleic acid-binding protein